MVGLAGEDGKGVLGDLMGHDPSEGGEREDWGGKGVVGADLCMGHSGCEYISLKLLISGDITYWGCGGRRRQRMGRTRSRVASSVGPEPAHRRNVEGGVTDLQGKEGFKVIRDDKITAIEIEEGWSFPTSFGGMFALFACSLLRANAGLG